MLCCYTKLHCLVYLLQFSTACYAQNQSLLMWSLSKIACSWSDHKQLEVWTFEHCNWTSRTQTVISSPKLSCLMIIAYHIMNDTSEQDPFWKESEVVIDNHMCPSMLNSQKVLTNQTVQPSEGIYWWTNKPACPQYSTKRCSKCPCHCATETRHPQQRHLPIPWIIQPEYAALTDCLKIIITPQECLPAELLADIFYVTLPNGFWVCVSCWPLKLTARLHPRHMVAKGPVLSWSFGHVMVMDGSYWLSSLQLHQAPDRRPHAIS